MIVWKAAVKRVLALSWKVLDRFRADRWERFQPSQIVDVHTLFLGPELKMPHRSARIGEKVSTLAKLSRKHALLARSWKVPDRSARIGERGFNSSQIVGKHAFGPERKVTTDPRGSVREVSTLAKLSRKHALWVRSWKVPDHPRIGERGFNSSQIVKKTHALGPELKSAWPIRADRREGFNSSQIVKKTRAWEILAVEVNSDPRGSVKEVSNLAKRSKKHAL